MTIGIPEANTLEPLPPGAVRRIIALVSSGDEVTPARENLGELIDENGWQAVPDTEELSETEDGLLVVSVKVSVA